MMSTTDIKKTTLNCLVESKHAQDRVSKAYKKGKGVWGAWGESRYTSKTVKGTLILLQLPSDHTTPRLPPTDSSQALQPLHTRPFFQLALAQAFQRVVPGFILRPSGNHHKHLEPVADLDMSLGGGGEGVGDDGEHLGERQLTGCSGGQMRQGRLVLEVDLKRKTRSARRLFGVRKIEGGREGMGRT